MMKRFTTLFSTFLYLCMLVGMIIGIVWADVPDSLSMTNQQLTNQN